MRLLKWSGVVSCLFFSWGVMAVFAAGEQSGRIYGKITTYRGEVLEGFIRWDKNEVSWVDLLDGSKRIPKVNRDKLRNQLPERRRTLKIFGLKIAEYSSTVESSSHSQSGIRLGNLRRLEVTDNDRALLVLKSGEQVEYSRGSSDIGDDIREIIVEDAKKGKTELGWGDIEIIDFLPAPASEKSTLGERLYGTLFTRRGEQFTGFVTWDVDEVLTSDILDGDDEDRRQKIEFGGIASIEREGSRSSRVTLKNGEEMILRGTNDVNSGNRGILIADPSFGQIAVDWREFEKLIFSKAPSEIGYSLFKPSRPLRGTVHNRRGETLKGRIRWDNDEESTWEILDGKQKGVDYDIEFSKIRTIERRPFGALVTLWEGRRFELTDSNDVDEDNRGLFITQDDGHEVYVGWADFRRVDFDKPE